MKQPYTPKSIPIEKLDWESLIQRTHKMLLTGVRVRFFDFITI